MSQAHSAPDPALLPPGKAPRHIAIIMDGNGRWAQARGLPRMAGHRAGIENLREVLQAAADFGVEMVTLYALSTENWSRPRHEVAFLLRLLEYVVEHDVQTLNERGVRIHHIGRPDELTPRIRQKIKQAEAETAHNQRLVLNVAFNYGGRAEIVDAVRRIVAEGLAPEQIDEAAIAAHLYTAGLPDPDLVIRTAGEMRLSNFLVWQAAYAEFYSAPVFWPDFGREELLRALQAYAQRDRRYGGLSPAPVDPA